MELRKEIAALEVEIMHLERHLLSLYRTAFQEHMSTPAKVPETKLQSKTRSPSRKVPSGLKQRAEPHVRQNGLLRSFQSSPAQCWASSDNQSCISSSKAISARVSIQVAIFHSTCTTTHIHVLFFIYTVYIWENDLAGPQKCRFRS